jgi:SRSO17 transposase
VDSQNDLVAAVGDSVAASSWRRVFDDVMARIGVRFARSETRRTVGELLLGLLAPVERKNGWWLAEYAGHVSPDRMQRLLRTAVWDEDRAYDDLRELVVARLGHPEAVLVTDETGYLKKGTCSVGVQRQYSGTAGRVENSQVGVFLTYASPLGRALVDARLYLPGSWCADRDRCDGAGVPEGVQFATKPQLALAMIEDALDAGMAVSYVTGDEVYGLDPALRARLRQRGVGYVLAIARNQYVQATEPVRLRPDDIAAALGAQAWERRSCANGSKGERFYDWAWVHDHTATDGGVHSLLIRRGSDGELAFYRCWTPHPVPLATLITVAGRRWSIEETFQAAKTHVGLDHYQCRGWKAWHRFTLLAMIALAILVIAATHDRPDHTDPRHDQLVALSVGELRRLIVATAPPTLIDRSAAIRWSWWRRRHQATARRSHYKRRDAATST